MIKASMTAYSTAVGPSSRFKKLATLSAKLSHLDNLSFSLEVLPMVLETLVKVLLALVPRAVMAVMHTTIIRASMTAYSTAVGPSSRFRKLTTAVRTYSWDSLLWEKKMVLAVRPLLRRGDGSVQSTVRKHFVGVGAQGGDRRDAHHDNESEHHGIFNRGRAVFSCQKRAYRLIQAVHEPSPFRIRDPGQPLSSAWESPLGGDDAGCPLDVHPFGSLATLGLIQGPWLCVTASRRFCLSRTKRYR